MPSHSLTMMNAVYYEYSFDEVWFTGQISKPHEIQFEFNNCVDITKVRYLIEPEYTNALKYIAFCY